MAKAKKPYVTPNLRKLGELTESELADEEAAWDRVEKAILAQKPAGRREDQG